MSTSASPLLGYNNNIPYKGRVFHVQTEDSGAKRPHVITHLFADGGRIVQTTKTSYAHFLGSDNLADKVRLLMREQHKAMVVSLRDGEFDDIIDPPGATEEEAVASSAAITQRTSDSAMPKDFEVSPEHVVSLDESPSSQPGGPSSDDAPGSARGRSDSAGTYRKIVGRGTAPPPGSSRGARPRRRHSPTRPQSYSATPVRSARRPPGGALFGQAVTGNTVRPPAVEAVPEPGEAAAVAATAATTGSATGFGAQFITERGFHQLVRAFTDATD